MVLGAVFAKRIILMSDTAVWFRIGDEAEKSFDEHQKQTHCDIDVGVSVHPSTMSLKRKSKLALHARRIVKKSSLRFWNPIPFETLFRKRREGDHCERKCNQNSKRYA